MEIKYSETAEKNLKKIARANKKDAIRILDSIEQYANNPAIARNVKSLKGKFDDLKRLRVGDYRVIFDSDLRVMYIYDVKVRKDIYND